MTDYTIVEPGFEYFDRHQDGYLKFLERCTRVCYKSEDHIREGSAERLLTKVVKNYEHLSVTEHESCIVKFKGDWIFKDMIEGVPLFATRTTSDINDYIVSGNIRMWKELLDYWKQFPPSFKTRTIQAVLHERWPFFFDDCEASQYRLVEMLDDNPSTNKNNLSKEEMMKHMTLTYKLIGDRSMSHQLVRHRMCAFSQESQRYCNYGKKGFQIVMPPKIKNFPSMDAISAWRGGLERNLENYKRLLDLGVPPEDARSVLPNCTKTEVVVTSTLGNWQHIFKHRAENPKAQWQIRGIMQGVQNHAKSVLLGVL